MSKLKYRVFLLVFVSQFVCSYCSNTSNAYYKPLQEEIRDCCKNKEKRIVLSPRIDVKKQNVKLKPRYFPSEDESLATKFSSKNIQFGYLPEVKSIHDLVELSSDEIGLPPQPFLKKPAMELWKLDDVKSMTGPKFLPDVLLAPEEPGLPVEDPNIQVEKVIDEQELNLGRFVVKDDPPPRQTNLLGDKTPQIVRQAIVAKEKYHPNVPEVVMDHITKWKEPDFMEELRRMKLEMQHQIVEPCVEEMVMESSVNQDTVTEAPSVVTDPPLVVTDLPVLVVDPPAPVVEEVIPCTEKSNVIRKETDTKAPPKSDCKKKEVRRRHRKVEKKVEVPVAPVPKLMNSFKEVLPDS